MIGKFNSISGESISEATAETSASSPDPFDLDALRLDQTFLQSGGAKKLTLTVRVRKP